MLPNFNLRIGQGIDIHPFVTGRPLLLGGVEIPHDQGLAGHSDADALLHAITDAVLGAAGLGDIGTYFPDTDEKWRDADSTKLLSVCLQKVKDLGWQVINLDSTIMTEAPKINPHIEQIKNRLSELLEIDVSSCNIKATTAEKMGFIGRKEALMAMAVVLLGKS